MERSSTPQHGDQRVVTLVVAVWWSSQLGSLRELGENLRGGRSYFGDHVTDGEEFDYIVVGAGAAGGAVAARLAQAGAMVLLVEAGGDAAFISKVPGAALILSTTSMNWNYPTLANNKSCLANFDGACRFARGRGVGGSTVTNYMMYVRGHRRDCDYNLTGWTWQDVEPYFRRYERLYSSHRLPEGNRYNSSGVLPIGYFGDSANPWHERIIEGLESLNVPYNPDVNGESQIGVTQVLGFTARGVRVNVAEEYLKLEGVKKNLKLVKNTRCTGVIIDENNVARGVTVFREPNETLQLYARHEVVLSAGAVATPQLLMLSGVGPKRHLDSFGIKVKADLPVGQDMSDHILPFVTVQVDDESSAASLYSVLGSKGFQAAQWLATGSGPMASIGLTDVTTFINTKCYNYTARRLENDRPECELPNLQLIQFYAENNFLKLFRTAVQHALSQRDEVIDELSRVNEQKSLIIFSMVVLRPESRGWLRLASADPSVPPAITPNYLDDERDVEEMVRALRLLEQLVETPVYKKHNASIVRYRFSGCPDILEAGYWACYARHMTQSAHHAVGTAALGRVLDARLRVHGVRRLRVADASALPQLPRGNTAATIIAFGERLADFLIEDRTL